MGDLANKIAELVKLNGGEIVGKTRLQKIVYLLEEKGLGYGAEFDYHNYGPFSTDVAFAADDAESLGYISSREAFGHHQIPYRIFLASPDSSDKLDEVSGARRNALNIMNRYSALVLELAATAVYLEVNGYENAAWDEVSKRKPLKATSDRIAKAKELVHELDLSR